MLICFMIRNVLNNYNIKICLKYICCTNKFKFWYNFKKSTLYNQLYLIILQYDNKLYLLNYKAYHQAVINIKHPLHTFSCSYVLYYNLIEIMFFQNILRTYIKYYLRKISLTIFKPKGIYLQQVISINRHNKWCIVSPSHTSNLPQRIIYSNEMKCFSFHVIQSF